MDNPNYSITTQYPVNDPHAPRMRDLLSQQMMTLDPMLVRPKMFDVYLYTISKREFTVNRPPLFRSLIIPACAKGERYRLVRAIPHPFPQPDVSPENGEPIVHYHDAKLVAQDICNPDNLSLDQDAYMKVTVDTRLGMGVNLSRQGVFWSLNNPPSEEELAAAEKRREAYYRMIFDQANGLAASDPRGLQDALTIDHHMAAEYFGRESSWHQVLKPMAECPNCGDNVKPGVAFHKSSVTGDICIIDRARAKAAGVAVDEEPEEATAVEAAGEPQPVKRGPGRPRKTELHGGAGS